MIIYRLGLTEPLYFFQTDIIYRVRLQSFILRTLYHFFIVQVLDNHPTPLFRLMLLFERLCTFPLVYVSSEKTPHYVVCSDVLIHCHTLKIYGISSATFILTQSYYVIYLLLSIELLGIIEC